MRFERPPFEYRYTQVLVSRAYWRWRASGFRHLPTLEEVANEDPIWESDVMRYGELVDFHEGPSLPGT